jgi:hypothetical protein
MLLLSSLMVVGIIILAVILSLAFTCTNWTVSRIESSG